MQPLLNLFLEKAGEGQLVGSRCKLCGRVSIPPRPFCPECQGETEIATLRGEGTIESFTVIHVPPAFIEQSPYAVALVRLEEGPMIMGRLLGVDVNQPETIQIGMKVRFEPLREKQAGEERIIVAFRPQQG